MRKITIGLVVLGVLALAFISMPMRAQNQGYPFPGFPPQFAPSRTSRPRPTPGPLPAKFNRVERPLPNNYIVVLNDDTAASSVGSIAANLANAHGGITEHVWRTALKGFSIRMPEAAAIALSKDPRVLYVEENGIGTLLQTQGPPTPWGLDRIDQPGLVGTVDSATSTTNGTYTYPNSGGGVHVYLIDTGILISHDDFKYPDTTSRALVAVDKVDDDNNPATPVETDNNGADGIDCHGHGTRNASIIGGNSSTSGQSYGVAKGVTLHSVRVARNPPDQNGVRPCAGPNLIVAEELSGIDWVAANAIKPAVANISLGCYGVNDDCDRAVRGAVGAGVTVVTAAGNANRDANLDSPGREDLAINVGATDYSDNRASFSNFGSHVDIFAPGFLIPGAGIANDFNNGSIASGTSLSAPHVTGVVALYLHDHPNGTASLPSIVQQVIKSNANICRYEDQEDQIAPCYPSTVGRVAGRPAGTNTPDRLLDMSFLPTPSNPIDNQRFFVWQHYADFKPGGNDQPDEQGLEFWTRNITGNPRLGTGCSLDRSNVNTNNPCTHDWRINTALAFWVDKYPLMFTNTYGLTSGNNSEFVKDCYSKYLKFDNADVNDPSGFNYWLGVLNGYGDPASPTGVRILIDQFLNSTGPGIPPGPPGYRVRFGAS